MIEPSGYQTAPGLLRARLREQLGSEPLVSRNGELWFFDLRPYAGRLRLRLGNGVLRQVRAATLDPLRVGCSQTGLTLSGGSAAEPVSATLTAELAGLEPGFGTVSAQVGDGVAEPVTQAAGTGTLSRQVRLAGGTGTVKFLATGPVPRGGFIDVTAATLTAQAYEPLTSSGRPTILAGFPSPTCQVHPVPSPQPATPAQ